MTWFDHLKGLTSGVIVITKAKNGPQCASPVKCVAKAAGYNGPKWGWGLYVRYWPRTAPTAFKQLVDDVQPHEAQEGDIVVFGKSLSNTGHIAFFESWAAPDSVQVWGQNAGSKTGLGSQVFKRHHIIHIWRFKPDIPPLTLDTLAAAFEEWNLADPKHNPINRGQPAEALPAPATLPAPAPDFPASLLSSPPLDTKYIDYKASQSGLKVAKIQGSIMAGAGGFVALKDQFLSDIHGVDLPLPIILAVYAAVALPVIYGLQKKYKRGQLKNGG